MYDTYKERTFHDELLPTIVIDFITQQRKNTIVVYFEIYYFCIISY